eukprot:scaffold115_cov241-Pinguiococcus_pyrenoidosus.AAC.14
MRAAGNFEVGTREKLLACTRQCFASRGGNREQDDDISTSLADAWTPQETCDSQPRQPKQQRQQRQPGQPGARMKCDHLFSDGSRCISQDKAKRQEARRPNPQSSGPHRTSEIRSSRWVALQDRGAAQVSRADTIAPGMHILETSASVGRHRSMQQDRCAVGTQSNAGR